jgi:hypothetical protein
MLPLRPRTPLLDGDIHLDGWTVRRARLVDAHERWDPFLRLIRVDYPDFEWMLAHVKAHLDLEHVAQDHRMMPPEWFTDRQEDDADALASLRFDLEDDDDTIEQLDDLPPIDGEPTVMA